MIINHFFTCNNSNLARISIYSKKLSLKAQLFKKSCQMNATNKSGYHDAITRKHVCVSLLCLLDLTSEKRPFRVGGIFKIRQNINVSLSISTTLPDIPILKRTKTTEHIFFNVNDWT